MFVPIFTLNLNQKILSGRVAIGEFDGRHQNLVAATTAEKVFVHNPLRQSLGFATGRMEASSSGTIGNSSSSIGGGGGSSSSGGISHNRELSMLNINQRVTAVAAGQLSPETGRDCLLVGTPTNLLAYDVENNADLFYKDVADGVNAIAVGFLGSAGQDSGAPATPLAIVGGNCSLQGFDQKGNDPFWTVTGDNVTSIAIMDYNNDGKNELIVGSEDFEIRIFAQDEILTEITETEAVTALAPIQEGRFGYALANGTVGVYEKSTRWWRIKSKNSASAIFSFDLDGDGVKELITGWSNGKLDARNDRSGEVVFKDNFNHSIAGLVEGDYRQDGKMELIACATEGEVRGYLPVASETRRNLLDINIEQESIRELTQRRSTLLLELRNYEQNQKAHADRSVAVEAAAKAANARNRGNAAVAAAAMAAAAAAAQIPSEMGVIPAQTQLSTALAINLGGDGKQPHVEVTLSTSNDTIIRSVLIFAEGIFEGECHVLHPRDPASTIHVPIFPPNDIPVDLHIKAFVGYKSSRQFHVFELTRQLPRFAMYCRLMEPSGKPPPSGWVSFQIKERAARVALWLNQNFLMGEEMEASEGAIDVAFSSLRHKQQQELHLKVESSGQVRLLCDSMDLCGDLVQNLAEYLALDDLQSTCDFPAEVGSMEKLLLAADELQRVRQRLSAEMADNSGMIRTLVVRAEDSRLMNDMKSMRKWYTQLYDINRDLIAGYRIRCNNHQELMDTLKMVNQIIQKAGRLRAGKSKARVITDCRTSIKENNAAMLLKVIRTGEA